MGCKANQFEGAVITQNLVSGGLIQVQNVKDADIFVLNSCTVTHKSDNEAFYLLRSAKNKNPGIINVLTGCIAQVEKENLLENDFVDFVVGNDEKLGANIIELSEKCNVGDIASLDSFTPTVVPVYPRTRASVKIQDGCDNRCAYCIIPFARGKSRSAGVNEIVEQVESLAAAGFKEVIFTGIHIGQYKGGLLNLLKSVETTSIARYRLGSLNPLEIDDVMLDFLAASTKFCPHFHLSLQSMCDKTLCAMNRHYTAEQSLALIEKINECFELPFVGSDIIVGFAGESEEDFEVTRKNLAGAGLSQIHVFPYSLRAGTAGAAMPNQVGEAVKQERAKIIRAISKQKHDEFLAKNLGITHEILVEKSGKKGITRNYITVETNAAPNTLVTAAL